MKIPVIGLPLWYYGKQHVPDAQPELALIAHVHNDRCVNIALFDAHGNVVENPPLEVFLLQDGDKIPEKKVYCAWPVEAKTVERTPEPEAEVEPKAKVEPEEKSEKEDKTTGHHKPHAHAPAQASHKKH